MRVLYALGNFRSMGIFFPRIQYGLFDHLVGGEEQLGRHFDAELLGCLEVDRAL